jgi:predicted transcriptional regulator
MKYEKLMAIKPLTTAMVQLLKDCHTARINMESDMKLYEQSAVEGLMERGLLEQKKDGKHEITYTITELGKLYIKHYFKK